MPTTDSVLHPGVILLVTVSLSYIWGFFRCSRNLLRPVRTAQTDADKQQQTHSPRWHLLPLIGAYFQHVELAFVRSWNVREVAVGIICICRCSLNWPLETIINLVAKNNWFIYSIYIYCKILGIFFILFCIQHWVERLEFCYHYFALQGMLELLAYLEAFWSVAKCVNVI